MDKFMETKWFMRAIAMLLAVLLYTSVNFDEKEMMKNRNTGHQEATETIIDIPVEVYYDEENLFVSGVPETVEVVLEGPRNIVQSTKALRNFTVYVDLSEAQIGEQTVKIQQKDISDKLSVRINPVEVDVSVQEKITEEFKVEPEFNYSLLAEGFEAEKIKVEPKTVKVTGARDVIEQITYVKATMDVKGEINSTVTKEAHVQVLDQALNKLNVIVEPKVVKLTIPVINPNKTVPIEVQQIGEPKKGFVVKSIVLDPVEAAIFGRDDVIGKIESILAEVDVSELDKDMELNVPLKLPEGINKIEPARAKATVTIEQSAEARAFSEISIQDKGLSEEYDFELLEPSGGTVEIVANGLSENVKALTPENIQIFINMKGLNAGEHDVDLEVSKLDGITWELPMNKAKVRLKEKTTEKDNV